MDIELIEIRDFLAGHHPFDALPETVLARLPAEMTVHYLRRGAQFPPPGSDSDALWVVRRGAIELRGQAGELLDKLGEGDCYSPSPKGGLTQPGQQVHAAEDTLLYRLPRQRLDGLRDAYAEFERAFVKSATERLAGAIERLRSAASEAALVNVKVGDLLARAPVCVAAATSIRQAAQRMREQRVSSLLITEDERLAGIVTDRDLRNRCLAEGLDTERPVRDIMTADVQTIGREAPAFEALMLMAKLNVHHLPVWDGDRLAGMISVSDLVRHESANAVYLVSEVRKAATLDALIEASRRLPELQIRLAGSEASARHVGQAVTAVTDALTIRLIELAQVRLGPAPMEYAWLAGGSQARREQTSHSDQDNALILAGEPDAAAADYFESLARSVNDGLSACGLVYCPGDVMASNPEWRQPAGVWRRYFDGWIGKPEPKALMLASVFFDLRVIHGNAGLLEALQQENLARTRANTIFLAHMAANALTHRPPLGFFRHFVLISGGEHDKTFDIKHRGVVPVVDLARLYALSEGSPAVNTVERLQAVAGSDSISHDAARSLVDAYELIATLRLRHQAARLREGQPADNYLPPRQLSTFERAHLRDAFNLIADLQRALHMRFPLARVV